MLRVTGYEIQSQTLQCMMLCWRGQKLGNVGGQIHHPKPHLGDPNTVPSATPPPAPSGCAYAHHRDADNTGCD